MDFTSLLRGGRFLLLGGLAAIALLLLCSNSSAVFGDPHPSTGPAEPNVVMSGSYGCTVSETQFIQPPSTDPVTFREMVDSINMVVAGGVPALPARAVGPGGSQPIFGGREISTPIVTGGIGTGHGFNDGTIEDCIRFAESMAAAVRGLDCVTSDVRHRPKFFQTETASFSFVCEGPASAQVHAIGELNRAVLALRSQPAL